MKIDVLTFEDFCALHASRTREDWRACRKAGMAWLNSPESTDRRSDRFLERYAVIGVFDGVLLVLERHNLDALAAVRAFG